MLKSNDLISDRYRIVGTIGHGGMSDVYEVKDIILKRRDALKILKSEYLNNIDDLIRFQNEARISACLNHPNIVKIYDYDELNGLPFIVNEFIKDMTIRDFLDYKRCLGVKESCSIMLQLCDALSYLHSKKIIHRDIKPLNIFYGVDGLVKISDFGISIILNSPNNINENKKVMGTAQYLAPELIKGDKASFQSDIYALGITFFELITGKVPFDGSSSSEVAKKVLNEKMISPLKIIPKTPKEVERIIFKATDKDLMKRYKNVEELRSDILKLYQNKETINKGRSFIARIFGLSND